MVFLMSSLSISCIWMPCHSFEKPVPLLCKMSIWGSLVMLTGQDFLCRQQNGVTPVVAASSVVGFIGNLGSAVSSDPAGAEAWAPIPVIVHMALGQPPMLYPCQHRVFLWMGHMQAAASWGWSHFTYLCVSVHSHRQAQLGYTKKQTGLFLKLPALKCLECGSVCVADKILQIGHFILHFLWTHVKYLVPSLRVLLHMFPAAFCRGCFQLQQVKGAQQHLLEGLCLKCLL